MTVSEIFLRRAKPFVGKVIVTGKYILGEHAFLSKSGVHEAVRISKPKAGTTTNLCNVQQSGLSDTKRKERLTPKTPKGVFLS